MTTIGEYLAPMSTSSSDIRPSDGTSMYSSQTTLPASRSVLSLNEEVRKEENGIRVVEWGRERRDYTCSQ